MKLNRIMTFALGAFAATAAFTQAQTPAARTGPGVQAPQDAKEPEVLKTCKVPPTLPGQGPGGRGPGGPGRGPAPAAGARDYKVTEIPGVIAAGQQWKEVWHVMGNNADGIIGTKDGGLLIAQNDKSEIVKLDQNGETSVVYTGLNISGAVSQNRKGALFVNNRGLNANIEQLLPKRGNFANKYNGDSFDCIGGVLNDLMADSKGGVYFTFGGLFYANPKGVVTKYGNDLRTNGIILSRDEKTLFVTNGTTLAALDVQKDGSLTNQREFVKWENGGGDGSAIDTGGRIYVTANPGVHVIGPDGKYLGLIPTPHGLISAAFSGPDKKMLYVVARENVTNEDWILAIPMLSQGFKGRMK